MLGDLSEPQIERLLQASAVGRIGCCENGRPYVVPMAFVYEDGAIYCHSGIGQKVEILRANPQVCFEVDEVKSLGEWRSAVLMGSYEELDEQERDVALHLLVEHLASFAAQPEHPVEDGPEAGTTQHILDRSSRHGVVFRIKIAEMTGRFETRSAAHRLPDGFAFRS